MLNPHCLLCLVCPYILDDHDHYHSQEDQTGGQSGFWSSSASTGRKPLTTQEYSRLRGKEPSRSAIKMYIKHLKIRNMTQNNHEYDQHFPGIAWRDPLPVWKRRKQTVEVTTLTIFLMICFSPVFLWVCQEVFDKVLWMFFFKSLMIGLFRNPYPTPRSTQIGEKPLISFFIIAIAA